jgi:integrase
MSGENHQSIPLVQHEPWNKGRLIGQKLPLKPKDVWSIRVRLQILGSKRDLALFNLAIDSKLRGCDLVAMKVRDVCIGGRVRERTTIVQRKTSRPVQFEITEHTRMALGQWMDKLQVPADSYLFPSRLHGSPHLSTRQYARIVHKWVESVGLDSTGYGTHSMPRTKAAQIYRKTGNLRAVQLLLGHTKLESEARKHRPLSRDRGRRRPHHFRTGQALTSRPTGRVRIAPWSRPPAAVEGCPTRAEPSGANAPTNGYR